MINKFVTFFKLQSAQSFIPGCRHVTLMISVDFENKFTQQKDDTYGADHRTVVQ